MEKEKKSAGEGGAGPTGGRHRGAGACLGAASPVHPADGELREGHHRPGGGLPSFSTQH